MPDDIDFDNLTDDQVDEALADLFPTSSVPEGVVTSTQKTSTEVAAEIEALKEYTDKLPAEDAKKARQAELASEIARLDAVLASDKATVRQRHELGTERAIRAWELEQSHADQTYADIGEDRLGESSAALELAAESLLAEAASLRASGQPKRAALLQTKADDAGKERIALAMEVDRRQLQREHDERLQSQAETYVSEKFKAQAASKLQMDLADPTLEEWQREALVADSHKPASTHKSFAEEVAVRRQELDSIFVESMALRVARGLPVDDDRYKIPASIRDERVELWQQSKVHRG